MRTRKEIEENIERCKPADSGRFVYPMNYEDKILAEVLLDIRDLLTNESK